MNLIRSLVFPWFVFFVAGVAGIIAVGLKFPHLPDGELPYYLALLGLGAVLCLMANLRSLGRVGIWMSESIPESLRYGSWRWIFRAMKAALVAAAFWFAGQLPWVPLIWHAAVIPLVFTICLFVGVWSLLGPLLKWCSNLAWSRAFSIVLSLPILATIPMTALFIGQTMVQAYRASQADLAIAAAASASPQAQRPQLVDIKGKVLSISAQDMRILAQEWPIGSGEAKALEIDLKKLSPELLARLPKNKTEKEVALTLEAQAIKENSATVPSGEFKDADIQAALRSPEPAKRAAAFRRIVETPEKCADYTKDIQNALEPKGPKNVVLWAVKAVECAEVRTVIALPKLTQIMMDHPDAQVRAAAIKGLKKYGDDNLRQISYLLVKRIGPGEPPEVVEATSALLAPLGADHQRWAMNRLKSLLDDPVVGATAAKALIRDYGRDDLVTEFVGQSLAGDEVARSRAIGLICLLPQAKRSIAEAHVAHIVATIKGADQNDPSLKALGCLGSIGFAAIREEVSKPQRLDLSVAARALAEMRVKDVPEALEVADSCSRNENPQVRKWCSQSLGQIGAPALPKILELLHSNNASEKDAGRNALLFFDDSTAKDELQQIMKDNSGWMANTRKLQIAKAIGTALARIENDHAATMSQSSAPASSSSPAPKEAPQAK